MSDPYNHRPENIQIIGVQGTGKTTLMLDLIRRKKARYKFGFDYKAAPGGKVGELAERLKVPSCNTPDDMLDATERGGYMMMNRLRFFPGEADRAFDLFSEFVRAQIEILSGLKQVICTELQDYTFTSDSKKPLSLLAMCDTGRSLKTDMLFDLQAWSRVHWGVRNQATEIYVFRQQNDKAIAPLEEQNLDAEEIRNLKNGEYIWKNLATGETKKGGKAF